MIARYPVWLVLPGESGPGRHRLQPRPDLDWDGPDEGLIIVQVPGLDEWDVVFSDSDERFKGGDLGPLVTMLPHDPAHPPHYSDCPGWGGCGHEVALACEYRRTDAGWWLVIVLPDEREVWVHEVDVPIDNHLDHPGPYCRRPEEVIERP